MALILDGTNGLSDVDGTAGTPAIRGSDANTGIFFPAADTIAFAEGGVESMRLDSAGNVGIGTSSPGARLQLGNNVGSAGAANQLRLYEAGSSIFGFGVSAGQFDYRGAAHVFYSDTGTERARIDSGGSLLVNRTSNTSTASQVALSYNANAGIRGLGIQATVQDIGTAVQFINGSGTVCGTISQVTSSVAYNTSSDYRLKHDIQPMTGALAKVAALKPVTYKWNVDDSAGEGFIAHELQEVCPSAVTGEKDAVDAEGNPQYQGIDTSFLTATLAAALQELHQIVKDQAAEIAELKAKLP